MDDRKITIQLPESLIHAAQDATGMGLTPTIRKGLELVAASKAYESLRKLKGKVKLSIKLRELRKDR